MTLADIPLLLAVGIGLNVVLDLLEIALRNRR